MKKLNVKKSELKTCNCAYLYADGHLVLVHEKNDNDAGRVNWATVYENVGIRALFNTGRIIVDPGALPFVLKSTAIEARAASHNSGSDNTKKANIRVETIILRNGSSHRGFIISNFPDMISSDIKYQPETSGVFTETKNLHFWGHYNIKKVYNIA